MLASYQNNDYVLTLFILGSFMEGVPPIPVTLLSLKLDDSNIVHNYFGVRSIFCKKKNQGKSIMTSL